MSVAGCASSCVAVLALGRTAHHRVLGETGRDRDRQREKRRVSQHARLLNETCSPSSGPSPPETMPVGHLGPAVPSIPVPVIQFQFKWGARYSPSLRASTRRASLIAARPGDGLVRDRPPVRDRDSRANSSAAKSRPLILRVTRLPPAQTGTQIELALRNAI